MIISLIIILIVILIINLVTWIIHPDFYLDVKNYSDSSTN